MMKKVLVTGSNGLLGQKLTDLYLKQTDRVQLIATARGANRHPVKEGYIYAEMDITDAESVNEIITRYQPDTIINTAAMTNVDACETDKEGCIKLNVDAVEYLVQAANKVNAHFIQLSTDFIFDGEDGPYDEEAEANPLSFYGESKLKGEEIVISKAKNWSIARTVLVYGIVADMSRSNIVLWVRDSLSQGKDINVVDDQFRTPTLAEDLAQGCWLIEEKEATGIYNISGKDFYSIYDMVSVVADHYKLDKKYIHRIKSDTLNQAAKRPPKTGFILDKAYRELGYKPHSFMEGIDIVEKQAKEATHAKQ